MNEATENIEKTELEDVTTLNEEGQDTQNEPIAQNDANKDGAPEAKVKKELDKRTTSALTGLAGFGLGVLTPILLFPDAAVVEEETGAENEVEVAPESCTSPEGCAAPEPTEGLQGRDMNVATGVNDAMSYNQAFAAARSEVGAGGLFVWRGHTYGTYYANEWNAMDTEEQQQYWADVYHTTPKIEYEPNPTEPVAPDDQAETLMLGENEHVEVVDDTNDDEPTDDNQTILHINEDDIELIADLDADGQFDTIVADVNRNEPLDLIVDTDGDGTPDTLVLDPEVDGEGNIIVSEDNIYDIDGVIINPSKPAEPDNVADDINPDDMLLVDNGETDITDPMC